MGKKKSQGTVVAVPDSLAGVSGELGKFEEAQRNAIIELVNSGEFTVEDAITKIRQVAEGSYSAKYLGSVPVAAAKLSPTMWSMFGKQIIASAGPRLKQLGRKPIQVDLVISQAGIRVINAKTTEVIEEELPTNVVFSDIDAKDKKKFAYVSHYSLLGLLYCHVFAAKDAKMAQQIPERIAPFVAANQKKQSEVSELDRHDKATGATMGIFEMQYLGTVSLQRTKSRADSVKEAVTMLMEQHAKNKSGKVKQRAEPVVVVVSSESIRIVEQESREVLDTVTLKNVSFATEVEGKKQELVAILHRDPRLKRRLCHLLRSSPKDARPCVDKIYEAFEVFKADRTAREGNPFMSMSNLTEPVPEALKPLTIPRRDMKALKVLGAGQFGEVYLAEQTVDGATVQRAVKMLRGGASKQDKDEFMHEATIMAQLKHDNLVCLSGVCASQRPWLAILEFVKYGDLLEILKSCRQQKLRVHLVEQMNFAVQIAEGLEYIASQRMIHMDIAARNIMVHTNNHVKIGDFGLARHFDEDKPYYLMKDAIKLSIRWLCVEAMGPPPKLFTERSDVWSFGVTLHEIFKYGGRPYSPLALRDVQMKVCNGLRLQQPRDCPENVFAFMETCWLKNPALRPSFKECVQTLKDFYSEALKENSVIRDIPATLFSASDVAIEEDDEITQAMDKVNIAIDSLLKEYDYPQA